MRLGPAIIGAILIIISVTVYNDGSAKLSAINSCIACSRDGAITEQIYGIVFGSIGAIIFFLGLIGGRKKS
ncbi:MAG: hypothetical protein ACYC7D_05740 [Nitrososphaerales archaeon]